MIKKVAITGATHGNELTGVYLVKSWQLDPKPLIRSNFKAEAILMNLKAVKECRRYIDRDLNRCFDKRVLTTTSDLYEERLAREFNQILGPKESENPNFDFIVDLHSTTANMGLSIVVSNDSNLTWRAISYLCQKEPKLKVYHWRGDEEDAFVDSIAPHGFAIEVGSVPQGVLRSDLFMQTKALIYHLLDFIEKENNGLSMTLNDVEFYDHEMLVDYPRDDDGDIIAMVHEDRQDRDFTLIKTGDPIFRTIDGDVIYYEGDDFYTLFINEAAYYEKGFAMTLAKKRVKKL
jgi:aspartoacylase